MSQRRKTMKAVKLNAQGGPENLVIQEIEIPTPGPRDVLIKVQYCGVDGHDSAIRTGIRRRGFTPGMILGHEIAGVAVEVGAQVSMAKVGDRVCSMPKALCRACEYCDVGDEALCLSTDVVEGGLAEYVACPEDSLFVVPEGVEMADAAVAACTFATPYYALTEIAEIKPGEMVLVTGAGGGLGMQTIQLVRLLGARAIGWTRSESKRAAIGEMGADDVICGMGETTPVWQQLLDLTEGKGVNLVMDYVGSAAFNDSFRGLARLGRYVMVGELLGQEVHVNPTFIFFKRAKILGSSSHKREQVDQILEYIRQGAIKPFIGGKYPLDEIQKVHALLELGAITGRAVMVP